MGESCLQPADQSGEVEGVVGISRERWDEERKEEEGGRQPLRRVQAADVDESGGGGFLEERGGIVQEDCRICSG